MRGGWSALTARGSTDVLNTATRMDDLGARFGADLTAAEVRYLMTNEWAQTADDVLWRRSKLGLRISAVDACGARRLHGAVGSLNSIDAQTTLKFYRSVSCQF